MDGMCGAKRLIMAKKGVMPKFIPDNRGRVRTEETKRKISETLKRKDKTSLRAI